MNAKNLKHDGVLPTFKTPYNHDHHIHPGESDFSASKTVPDQTLSVREILQRHARGIPVTDAKTPIYLEDTDLPDMQRMELTDQMELIQSAQRLTDELRKRVKDEEDSEYKAKLDELAELQLELKALKDKNPDSENKG